MPRFTLSEYAIPDYAKYLPKHDEENALWPRLSGVAKMLHEIEIKTKEDEAEKEQARIYAGKSASTSSPETESSDSSHTNPMRGNKFSNGTDSIDKEFAKTVEQKLLDPKYNLGGGSTSTSVTDGIDSTDEESVEAMKKKLLDLKYNLDEVDINDLHDEDMRKAYTAWNLKNVDNALNEAQDWAKG